jgi:hypothetical protein
VTRVVGILRGSWLAIAYLIAVWFGLLLTHEVGHVLHAWVSGGRVERVVVPLLGFSRTDVSTNPQPVLVAWGGFVWGGLLPLAMLGIANLSWKAAARGFRGFAAIAVLANAAYACSPVGDVEDIVRAGGSRWPLIVYALFTVPVGLFVLERFINATPVAALTEATWRWVAGMTAAAAGVIGLALLVTVLSG